MKNKPIEFEYFSKRLNQRIRFVSFYDGYKTRDYKGKLSYYACFTDVKEYSTSKKYRSHTFVHVNKADIDMMEASKKDIKYTFTAIISIYKNKPKGKQWYLRESFGLSELKKLQTLEKFEESKT